MWGAKGISQGARCEGPARKSERALAATYPCDSVGKVPDATFGKARASQERGGDVLVVVQRVAQHLGLRDKREARILRVSEILAKRASIGGHLPLRP